MNHWLLKTEPDTYAWSNLVREKSTRWDGVRNHQACNNLRAMREGDFVFVYHSGKEKQIVGIARVIKEAYQDPTIKEGSWVAIDIAPEIVLQAPVTLAQIKGNKILSKMLVHTQPRLSVSKLQEKEWDEVLKLAKTKV